MKQQIALALHSPRSALHADSLEAAGLLVAAKCRELVDVEMHIARDEQIDMTVTVVVCPRTTRAETFGCNSGLLGDVFEFAIA